MHMLNERVDIQGASIKFEALSAIDITPPASSYTLYSIDTVASFNLQLETGPIVSGSSSSQVQLRIDPPEPIPEGFLFPLTLFDGDYTLPASEPAFKIRFSPASLSRGELRMTLSGARNSLLFDVFAELSVDGGQNWIPASDAMHMVAIPEPATIWLLAAGAVGCGAMAGWRRHQRVQKWAS
jgi:hypothetical protein